MTTSTFKSVNLLPTYFQTDKNSKFLSSTIDQLIQPAKIERLNAFVGSTATPNYSSSDSYVVEPEISRQLYQLDPALVINNIQDSIQSIITLKDLSNEIGIKGGYNNNFDRLFRSEMYPYDPPIDLDKFNNYQNYFWLPSGPFIIDIDEDDLDVAKFIVGNTTTTVMVHGNSVQLLNGMLVTFTGLNVAYEYQYKEFFVEGVGTSIVLVPLNELITPEKIAQSNDELYDSTKYDFLGFDSSENFPLNPKFIVSLLSEPFIPKLIMLLKECKYFFFVIIIPDSFDGNVFVGWKLQVINTFELSKFFLSKLTKVSAAS